jgi:hypothetical protein
MPSAVEQPSGMQSPVLPSNGFETQMSPELAHWAPSQLELGEQMAPMQLLPSGQLAP